MYRNFAPYFRYVWRRPMVNLAVISSSIVTYFLLSFQPKFLKAFIDQAGSGESREHLMVILLTMLFGLLLAFLFDTIEAALKHRLLGETHEYFREIYFKYCQHHRPAVKGLAFRGGIDGLVKMSMNVGLDLFLSVINLLIVVIFIASDSLAIAGLILLMITLGQYISEKLSSSVARSQKIKESSLTQMTALGGGDAARFSVSLRRFLRFDQSRFYSDTLLVLVSFLLFRVFPIAGLYLYLQGSGITLGSLASLFLFFQLMHGPYKQVSERIRLIQTFWHRSESFRYDLEQGMEIDQVIEQLPKGMIRLSEDFRHDQKNGHVHMIDEYSEDELQELMKEAARRPQVLVTKEKSKLCQFTWDNNGLHLNLDWVK